MAPFVSALKAAARMVEDTQDQAFSEAWQAYLAYYGALTVAAGHDAALAEEMKELVEFMKIYATKKKPGTAKAAPEAAPPAAGTPAAGTPAAGTPSAGTTTA